MVHNAWKDGKKKEETLLLTTQSPKYSLHTAPVWLARLPSGKKIATNAIHDTGASCTILDRRLAEELQLTGTEVPLTLETFGPDQIINTALEVKLYVYDVYGIARGQIEATVIPSFVDVGAVDWNELKTNFPHLRDIKFPKPNGDGLSLIHI